MKLFYKKVGDTFSLDEYNAMCYLLSLQKYTENIEITTDTYTGEYGEYQLVNSNEALRENTTGYVVSKKDKTFKILLNPYIPNANFSITFNVYKNNTNVNNNNITSTIHSNELYDSINENAIEEKQTTNVEVQLTGNTLSLKPSDLKLENGDWISRNITINAEYSEPIINWEDGEANTEEQIICETFDDLEQAISTTPENGFVSIRLKGNKEYIFTKEIIIENKSVSIVGGNNTSGAYSILNAQDLYRHFYVGAGSTLTLRSCLLKNGNGSIVYDYHDAPKRGGSIFMNSNFITTSNGYTFNPSIVTIENCKFRDCHANRGGAICNVKGKLSCNNVMFDNCVATKEGDKTACFGGAILNESVTMYHDSSNQLYIDKSTTTYNENTTIIDLKVSKTQNLRNFIDSQYALPTLTCICGNNKYEVTSVKTSQFGYLLTVKGKINTGTPFYFVCKDFVSRNLKITKEGTTYYTDVIPEVID